MPAAGRRLLVCALLLVVAGVAQAQEHPMVVYFGTYSQRGSQGIYVYRFDPAAGTLTDTGLRAAANNASYLAIHPSGRFLYCANEDWSHPMGQASAFAVDAATGALTFLDSVSSHGGGPCYVTLDHSGRELVVANYGTGSIAALPIAADGGLGEATAVVQHHGSGPNKQRQEHPHAHSVTIDPGNRFVFACDLGCDRIFGYHLDPNGGTLAPNDPPSVSVAPGTGPRHFAFHPNGRLAWVVNEMGNSVTGFRYDAEHGALTALDTISTLPFDFTGHSTAADIHLRSDGRFLYASNRGDDSLVVFAVDGDSGHLTFVQRVSSGGKTPRNFAIDPSGKWLLAANQDGDNVVVFKVDADSGQLTPTGQTVKVPAPVCIKFLP
jgi:6-phosphogluconolactonase